MGGWSTKRMDELCEITSSKRIFAADYVSEGVPFYRGREITEKFRGNLDVSTELFISEEKFAEIESKFGAPVSGDLLLTSVGTLGSVYVVKPGDRFYFKDGNLTWFRHFNGLDSQFLSYWLISPQGKAQLQRCTIGAAQPALTIVHLKEIEIEVPPLPVQRRIAEVLSTYDELIQNNQQRIRILEEIARLLYREWFVEFRFPGHAKVPRISSPLGNVPEDWEVVSINDVCERVTDGSHFSPKSVTQGLPMASSKDMHDWGITLETCRFIGREDFDELVRSGCKARENDVLVTKDGANYLKHIFVNRAELDLVLLSSIAILRPNSRINPHLLAAILKWPENKERLKNYVTGAAIPRIVLKDFKRFQFVLPSKVVQAEWASIAESLTALCWTFLDQIANLRRMRELLLPRLLASANGLDAR